MSIPINHGHLHNDISSGRSSTRLHAPPGGKSSMGTSFGWAEEAPKAPQQQNRNNMAGSQVFGNDTSANAAPERTFVRQNKKEFVDSRIGAHSANENSNRNQQGQQQQQQQQAPCGGFGDTGRSAVRINNAPGGKSSGNILSWN
ncbi:hypothetical protein T484DRAFT_1828967 [Baffinella frigidus]|jgi:hypothetical protein|nr:hypothetical protein T484DRAFT_1828967 [Cryptophyta sp. CCMP2293]